MNHTLRDALALLDEGKSWGHGHLFRLGRRCLVGAIMNADADNQAFYELARKDPHVSAVAATIREMFPDFRAEFRSNVDFVWLFNDDMYPNFEPIRTVLEKTAIKIEEGI